MNLDAKTFIENDELVKATVPTLCAITRRIRRMVLENPPGQLRAHQNEEQEKVKALREMARSNLNDLVADLMMVKSLLAKT